MQRTRHRPGSRRAGDRFHRDPDLQRAIASDIWIARIQPLADPVSSWRPKRRCIRKSSIVRARGRALDSAISAIPAARMDSSPVCRTRMAGFVRHRSRATALRTSPASLLRTNTGHLGVCGRVIAFTRMRQGPVRPPDRDESASGRTAARCRDAVRTGADRCARIWATAQARLRRPRRGPTSQSGRAAGVACGASGLGRRRPGDGPRRGCRRKQG